jgi:hypothetical protein
MSKYTSFVGIERRENFTEGVMEIRKVPIRKIQAQQYEKLQCKSSYIPKCLFESFQKDVFENEDESVVSDQLHKKMKLSENLLEAIIKLQKWNGSWTLSGNLLSAMRTNEITVSLLACELFGMDSLSDETMTALVLIHIKASYMNKKQVWKLLYINAVEYIKKNGIILMLKLVDL